MTKDLHMKRAKLTQGNARACASHGARAAGQVPNGVRNLGFARSEVAIITRDSVRSRSSFEATAEE